MQKEANEKIASMINLSGKSVLFMISVSNIKPQYSDKEGIMFSSASRSMERFFNEERIAVLNSVEDIVHEMEKFEDDKFIWFVVALSFLHYNIGDNSHNVVFDFSEKGLLILATEYLKEHVIKGKYPYTVFLEGELIDSHGKKLGDAPSETDRDNFIRFMKSGDIKKLNKPKNINVTEVLKSMDMVSLLKKTPEEKELSEE